MRWMMVVASVVVLASPAAAQQVAPVTVYFDAGSVTLDADDRAGLDRIVEHVRKTGGSTSIVLAGHADNPEGSAQETVGLSQRRANSARDYLVSLGVPAGILTTQAFGETRPAIQSTTAQWENRRVEVTVGPGSGW